MLRDWSAAFWAVLATVARSSPRAAEAPAIFADYSVEDGAWLPGTRKA